MIEEIWKDIQGFEGLYKISNFGRVLSFKKGKMKNLCIDKDGYLVVNLYKKNKNHNKKVHRLVADAFIPNPNNLPEVNHKNENNDKANNYVDNLEWCTKSKNMKHSFLVLKNKPTWKGKFGVEHPTSNAYKKLHSKEKKE